MVLEGYGQCKHIVVYLYIYILYIKYVYVNATISLLEHWRIGTVHTSLAYWRLAPFDRQPTIKRAASRTLSWLNQLHCSWHVFWFFSLLVLFIFTGGLQNTSFLLLYQE